MEEELEIKNELQGMETERNTGTERFNHWRGLLTIFKITKKKQSSKENTKLRRKIDFYLNSLISTIFDVV